MHTKCPAYCIGIHSKQPGNIVHHHTAPILLPATTDGRQLRMLAGQYDFDPRPRLTFGGHEYDLPAAEVILAELAVKVGLMRRVQAALDLNVAVV